MCNFSKAMLLAQGMAELQTHLHRRAQTGVYSADLLHHSEELCEACTSLESALWRPCEELMSVGGRLE